MSKFFCFFGIHINKRKILKSKTETVVVESCSCQKTFKVVSLFSKPVKPPKYNLLYDKEELLKGWNDIIGVKPKRIKVKK